MHLNDLCTGNQFNLIQSYSTADATVPNHHLNHQQTTNLQQATNLKAATTTNIQTNQLTDDLNQLNSSLSSSSGGCTSTSSSGFRYK